MVSMRFLAKQQFWGFCESKTCSNWHQIFIAQMCPQMLLVPLSQKSIDKHFHNETLQDISSITMPNWNPESFWSLFCNQINIYRIKLCKQSYRVSSSMFSEITSLVIARISPIKSSSSHAVIVVSVIRAFLVFKQKHLVNASSSTDANHAL